MISPSDMTPEQEYRDRHKTVGYLLTNTMHARLVRLCERLGTSKAEYAREALIMRMAEDEYDKQIKSQYPISDEAQNNGG